MLLIIDHFDSFIDMIIDYCKQLGYDYVKITTDKVTPDIIQHHKVQHIIIGPGPGHPSATDLLPTKSLLHQAIKLNLPVLGICLGHQLIGEFFGGEVKQAPIIMHGQISKLIHNSQGILHSIPNNIDIARYHSLIIDKQILQNNPYLNVTGYSSDDEIMSIMHKSLPIYGIQFHPESVATQFGLNILNNFLQVSSSSCISNMIK